MRRKIVLHGPSTLTVSLPSEWVRKRGLVKGNELLVEEVGQELHIKSDTLQSPKIKTISLGTLKRVGKSSITSSYRQGFDEIKLNYEDPSYIETIQEILSKELTGFEIIGQTAKGCIIKDLTGHSSDEFDNALRRTWLLLIDLSQEAHQTIKDSLNSRNIKAMDHTINKFSNYCMRVLVKKKDLSDGKKLLLYHLVRTLEKIGDHYKDLCENHDVKKYKVDVSLLDLMSETNVHLNELSKAFYKEDMEMIEKLFERNKSLSKEISSCTHPSTTYLSSISREIKDLLSLTIEMKL